MAQPVDPLVAELVHNLRIVAGLSGRDSARYRDLLADYRALADGLRCRGDLEEALLQALLQPGAAEERPPETRDSTLHTSAS